MNQCVACGNKLRIVGGRCAACRTPAAEASGKMVKPEHNQISGRSDEEVMRCICGSYDIHFCYRNQSLRCRKCSRLLSYIEAVSWQQG